MNLLRARDVIEERIAGELASVHGLMLKEAMLLMHLERAPLQRLTRVELAKRLHASASTVTRMATPMEKLGLVSRQSDDRDARLAFVVLTKAGQTKITEARATLARQAADLFQDRWQEDEIEALSGLLARLVASAPGRLA
jgi:DNA-binding MarR family transcriptional regulator